MEVQKRESIQIVGYSPVELGAVGIPAAVARAGGVGVLDLEFAPAEKALASLQSLLRATDGRVGVRLGTLGPDIFHDVLEALSDRPHWLVVSQAGAVDLAERCAALPISDCRELVIEVTDAAALDQALSLPVRAIVARGHEAGGRVGEDSSLILLQRLLPRTSLPIYVEGGVGVNAAAACYAAGAAGVVLGAQLLLMPESPLPQAWQDELEGLAGMEARVFGERLGHPVRVLSRPGYKVSEALQKLEDNLSVSGAAPAEWLAQALPLVGWDAPGLRAWPVGQELGLAQRYRDQYKTTGRLVKAVCAAAMEQPAICRDTPPLAGDAPLAQSHGTRYPIAQGPMTRVSDCPQFADGVAKAGGLPFMALALMSGEQVRALLQETRELLGDKPWGVGLLGFVPQQLRDAQVKAVFEVKPPFALIAGGRPDQAAEFERNGIPAYIHVPAPELLKLFLEQGATRFVFEGRECGGHVGPLSSLMLWETMIEVLLERVPRGQESKIHVLFAGGIHDARSAALVSVMAARLAQRGFRIGVLMGSAYLFTEEIVSSGAVKHRYQTEAIACDATINLETGPGHASRCAVGPFSRHFYSERARALAAQKSADEVRDHLEDLNLGRLRLAAKGSIRREGGDLVEVDDQEQVNEGMYMLGQVATLRDSTVTIEDLHRDVSEGSAALLGLSPPRAAAPRREARPSDIAIIGIGTLLPKAQSSDQYWQNIINKVSAITEIPRHRWDSRLYFDADRTAEDKIYSKWGGFLDDVAFDPMAYGIPPNALKSIEPLQLLALETARRALEDAGYGDGDFDREHTSVILGAGGGAGDLGMQYAVRSELPMFVETPLENAFDRLPEWTENSFPGLLLNVVAGRIANRFDLGGTNCIVDAACASSLAAFDIAVNELESGRSKVAIVGGVDTVQSPFGYMCFSKTQALSPRGEANTFDKRGDGIVISEGLAMVVLKPLADAERDGDRIYSVIKSIGSSSDGKALGLTAPLPAGQMRALKRAYEKAGISPASLGLLEAHGTGTAVGDSAELETIVSTLRAEKAQAKSIAVGSVKAQLGHTKATAGTAGLVKAVLALHHKVLPPHVGVKDPLDPIAASDSPVYLLDEARPWLGNGATPRRAGVSAFGFGGTNFHVVLEEYSAEYRAKAQPLGAEDWPAELFVFRATDPAAIKTQLTRHLRNLDAGAQPRLADLAYTCAVAAERSDGAIQAAAVVDSLATLRSALTDLVRALDSEASTKLPPHVNLHRGAGDEDPPAIAFLFPGQGAQYTGMLREATLYLRESRDALECADSHFSDCFALPLSQLIHPPQAFDEESRSAQQRALTDTHVAQPAIVTSSLGYLDLLARVGIKPQMAAGHSLGEYVALHAAGVMSRDVLLDLAETRGRAMGAANADGDAGSMAVIMASREEVEAYIADYPGLVLANHNAPTQCAISGVSAELDKVAEELTTKGVMVVKLPVSGAFHSRLMEAAQTPLTEAIKHVAFNAPTLPVFGNTTGDVYSNDPADISDQLQRHMLGSVQFVDQIENMYRDGARIFLEVGPKNTLTGMVKSILGDRPHTAVSTDNKEGGLAALLGALAQLFGSGVPLAPSALFADRSVTRLPQVLQAPSLPATAWMVDGGGIRPQNDPVHRTGKQPALTLETREESAAQHAASAVIASPVASQAVASAIANGASSGPPVAPAALQPTTPVQAKIPPSVQVPTADARALELQALDLYHSTMRQFLATQEGVMQSFLGGSGSATAAPPVDLQVSTAAAVTPASSAVSPAQNIPAAGPAEPLAASPGAEGGTTPVSPVAEMASGLSRDDLAELVLRQTAERTGYPVEMLSLDQDIEAELGIDSIKRVEIVGALMKDLPDNMQAALQAEVEALTRAKTLAEVIEGLAAHLPAPGAVTPADLQSSSPAPAATSVSGPSRNDLSEMVLQQTAERTGYPVEMLSLDQDIEAELGIDSIKRVEIVGALMKDLPESMQASLQAEVETLTRAKTLAEVIEGLAAHLPAPASGAVTPAVPQSSSPAPAATSLPGLSREDLAEMVLRQTAERTGYPVEMLSLDQDIEAELGIDSIKRVEIVGALMKDLPESMQAALQAEVEALTRAKTLAEVIDGLAAHLPTGGDDSVAAVFIEQPEAKPAEVTPLVTDAPRFLMTSRVQSRPDTASSVKAGLFLLSGDGAELADAVSAELQRRGNQSLILSQSLLDDPDALEKELGRLDIDGIEVRGLIHLACNEGHESMNSLEAWRNAGNRYNKALFRLIKACGKQINGEREFRVLSVSAQGGHFGRDGKISSPAAGGSMGLLKSAAAEWPQLQIKNLDLEYSVAPELVAGLIVDELLCEPDAVEVGYSCDERRIFYTAPAPLKSNNSHQEMVPGADWVILATGGARGITYSVLEALVPDGATVVIAARSPEPGEEPDALATASDSSALRALFMKEAKARGENPSIVDIERRVQTISRDRSVRENLAALRDRGIKVEYHQADIAKETDCSALIDSIYDRHGRLDAVIHGAGIIEDKLIADKAQDSFDRVYDTKADSGFLLSRSLRPQGLKWLMFFTSVAGRYGNRGQSDYAAGNEVLNRLAWFLNAQWPATRVISVNWGPWDSGGMVSEGVKRQFSELGIMAISPQAGVAFARNELFRGLSTDVEVVAGQGPWKSDGPRLQNTAPPYDAESGSNLVFAGNGTEMTSTGAVSMDREFSLARDPYLDDHRLDGDPVVPAAVCTEWMAETAQLGWPDLVVSEVQDVRVLQGIQFEDGDSALARVLCRVSSHADAASVKVSAELKDTRSGRTAYRAGILLRDRLPDAPAASMEPLVGGEPMNVTAAYRDYLFHGPRFQLATEINAINAEGIDARVCASDALSWIGPSDEVAGAASEAGWLFDPGLVDVSLQMCLIWGRVHNGVSALPARFGNIRRYKLDSKPDHLLLRFRIRPESTAIAAVFDAEILSPEGLVLMALEDIETIGSERFNRLADETDEMGRLTIARVGQAG